jgi:BMFP domain-containing protein YqiC
MAAATAQAAVQASKSETFPMTTSNRLLDDMARLMTDAAGAAQGVRREVETVMKTQAQRILAEMDVVTREEFEAVREMAIMAREENEKLAARIAALEEARAMGARSSEQGG